MDIQHVGHGHRQAGEHRVDQVQKWCEEHKREFDRLSHAGQKRGQRHRQENPAHHLAAFRQCIAVHRQARGGQAEQHDREHTGHELAAFRVAGKIAGQVAGDDGAGGWVGKAAEHKPRHVVEDMVQAGDDQQAVEHAKHEGTKATAFHQQHAKTVDAVLDRRPDQAKDHPQGDRRKPGDNRHKPSPTKEGQVLRQLDVLEAVIQPTGHQAAGDTGEHAHVDGGVHHLERGDHHQVTNRPGQTCRAVIVAGKTHRNTDGEDQRQVGENCLPSIVHHRDVQKIGVAQAQQEAGDRQNRDRQHQRAAEALQAFDKVLVHGVSPYSCCFQLSGQWC